MTPEQRVLRALDELRDAMGAVLAQRHKPGERPALLTLTDAARAIGCSRATVSRWADSGRLRTVGGRKARRVPRAEIERLAAGPPEPGQVKAAETPGGPVEQADGS